MRADDDATFEPESGAEFFLPADGHFGIFDVDELVIENCLFHRGSNFSAVLIGQAKEECVECGALLCVPEEHLLCWSGVMTDLVECREPVRGNLIRVLE